MGIVPGSTGRLLDDGTQYAIIGDFPGALIASNLEDGVFDCGAARDTVIEFANGRGQGSQCPAAFQIAFEVGAATVVQSATNQIEFTAFPVSRVIVIGGGGDGGPPPARDGGGN